MARMLLSKHWLYTRGAPALVSVQYGLNYIYYNNRKDAQEEKQLWEQGKQQGDRVPVVCGLHVRGSPGTVPWLASEPLTPPLHIITEFTEGSLVHRVQYKVQGVNQEMATLFYL